MSSPENVVFTTYSEMADTYDDIGNVRSCWGVDTERIVRSLTLKDEYGVVADVGCGTGGALRHLASQGRPWIRFVGVEPAQNMRLRALFLNREIPNVEILEGAFERIPMENHSVDYMFSINAFHWVADLPRSMDEIVRVMQPDGEMDHFFIGRFIGREFVRATTPIFMKYMGIKRLLEAAKMRQFFTPESARAVFAERFGAERVEVEERFDTYYDTVEGHLGWWVRIEPQLLAIPEDQRPRCEEEVREALARLDTGAGVPYTKHTLHVRVR